MKKNITISFDGEAIGGISTHLYPKNQRIHSRPPVYLIPDKYGQMEGRFSEGDHAILCLEDSKKEVREE
jgi:hypothetical protein